MTGRVTKSEGAVDPRRPPARPQRPVLYLAAALCFLLPFGTVSCEEKQPVDVTGIELATKSVPGTGRLEDGEPNFAQEVENRGFVPAALALAAALLGFGLALAGVRNRWTFGVALFGLAALGILRFVASDADTVRVEVGFIGALVCFGLAVLDDLNAAICSTEKRSSTRIPPGALPRL
jgi:hypothetical protein